MSRLKHKKGKKRKKESGGQELAKFNRRKIQTFGKTVVETSP